QLAKEILLAKGNDKPLGYNWYLRFLEWHPELHTCCAYMLEQSRQDAETDKGSIRAWFDLVTMTCLKYDILLKDEYNMDEKGVLKGIGQAVKVLVSRHNKMAITAHPGNRENVSIIKCVLAVGYSPLPFMIFQGQTI
ncbi:hypothetical protein B0T25DRAFT_442644, partial [Lasiosphaeria hispida]